MNVDVQIPSSFQANNYCPVILFHFCEAEKKLSLANLGARKQLAAFIKVAFINDVTQGEGGGKTLFITMYAGPY